MALAAQADQARTGDSAMIDGVETVKRLTLENDGSNRPFSSLFFCRMDDTFWNRLQ
jgi:hypothetical protein